MNFVVGIEEIIVTDPILIRGLTIGFIAGFIIARLIWLHFAYQDREKDMKEMAIATRIIEAHRQTIHRQRLEIAHMNSQLRRIISDITTT